MLAEVIVNSREENPKTFVPITSKNSAEESSEINSSKEKKQIKNFPHETAGEPSESTFSQPFQPYTIQILL
jgi:hypothetical protein